jgi:hypothetical protein
MGGGLKILHSRLAPEELTLDHKSAIATGWDLDLASLVAYRASLSILPGPRSSFAEIRGGLAVHNAFARDISYEVADDPLGREARAGIALRASVLDLPPFGYLLGATVSAERNWILDPYSAKPGSFYGAEVVFLGLVSIRHGWIRDDDSQIHDTITGYGLGFDLKLAGGSARRGALRHRGGALPERVVADRLADLHVVRELVNTGGRVRNAARLPPSPPTRTRGERRRRGRTP